MIVSYSKTYYQCVCDNCKNFIVVEKTTDIYNRAQAVRSVGWSYAKNRTVLCKKCRKHNVSDNYRYK